MNTSKSSLFLMELVISIFFFALASAVCIQLFAKSHTMSQKTIAQNQIIVWVQNLSELWLASSGDQEEIKNQINDLTSGQFSTTENSIIISLDKDWNITDDTSGLYHAMLFYSLTGSNEENISMIYATVSILKNDDTLYSIQLQHHIPEACSYE